MCGQTSVCDAYAEVDAVVVAKVISFKPAWWQSTFTYGDGKSEKRLEEGQEVVLSVSRWIKGKKQSKLLKLSQPNSSCDWTFEERDLNKAYLFYLRFNNENKRLAVASCGRSAEIRNAGDDLSWLNGLPKSLNRSRISGAVKLNDDSNTFPLLPQVPVLIQGPKKTYSLITNNLGFYEQWDLPAGKYRVSTKNPKSLTLSWTTSVPENNIYFWSRGESDLKALDVTIEPGKCGGVDFMFEKK